MKTNCALENVENIWSIENMQSANVRDFFAIHIFVSRGNTITYNNNVFLTQWMK